MVDRPTLFSAPMVRALLDGRKTKTRRALNPQPYNFVTEGKRSWNASGCVGGRIAISDRALLDLHHKPDIGDRLWVREAFSYDTLDIDRDGTLRPWYWADGNMADADQGSGNFTKPKPSIHMPRWASRITLTVTDVRVERLQDISDADAEAEGITRTNDIEHGVLGLPESWDEHHNFRDAYFALWDIINGKGAAAQNPWVAAISFDVRKGNIDG